MLRPRQQQTLVPSYFRHSAKQVAKCSAALRAVDRQLPDPSAQELKLCLVRARTGLELSGQLVVARDRRFESCLVRA